MLYELARLDITEFRPGAVLFGKSTIKIHTNIRVGSKRTWATSKPLPQISELTPERMTFSEMCWFVRISPIGLTANDVMDGEMDFQLSHQTLGETLGKDTLNKLVDVCRKNGVDNNDHTSRITFIGAFKSRDNGTWSFEGVLPMDERLKSIIVEI